MGYDRKYNEHYDAIGRDLFDELLVKEAGVLPGAAAGSLLGAGVGYSQSSDDGKLRGTLLGAGLGGALGAGAGALISRARGGGGGGGGASQAFNTSPKQPSQVVNTSPKQPSQVVNTSPKQPSRTPSSETFAQQRDRIKQEMQANGYQGLSKRDQIFQLDASRSQWSPNKIGQSGDDVILEVFKNNLDKVKAEARALVANGDLTKAQAMRLFQTTDGKRAIMMSAWQRSGSHFGVEAGVKVQAALGKAMQGI